MKKWQRKQRVKEMRKSQKEAQVRNRELAGAASACASPASPAQPAAAAAGESSSTSGPGGSSPAPSGAGLAIGAPALLPPYTVEEAVADVTQTTSDARNALNKSKLVSEDEAAEMLSFAARRLSDVIDAGHRALSQVSPQRLREATEIATAQPAVADTSRLASRLGINFPMAAPQQRPRRGADPVITLMRLMVSAVSLLQRVLNRLHPKLRRAA